MEWLFVVIGRLAGFVDSALRLRVPFATFACPIYYDEFFISGVKEPQQPTATSLTSIFTQATGDSPRSGVMRLPHPCK
eukprot:6193563-Pleurochrysis_carterae.AAC.2